MSVSAEDYGFLAQDLNWVKGIPALQAVISTFDGLQQFRSADLKIIATFFRDRFDRHMKLSGTKRELSLRILSTLNMLKLRAGTAIRPNGNLAQPPTDVSMWVKLPEFAAFQDPFYQPTEVLAARAFNSSASMVGSTLSFQLTAALAEKVKQQATGWVEIERVDGFEAEKGQIALHLRLFNTMSMQDIPWDPNMMLSVDRRTVEIMPGPKRKCTQRARHRFRCMPTVPVDVTGHVARDATGTHIIEFRPPRETGIVVLQSIMKRSVIELVNQVKTEQKARKAAGKEHVVSENDEADDEIEEVNTVVSLRCPLTYCRVQTPSKGVRCRHQRCFDLQGYLQFVQQKKLWHCPICDKSAPFEELIIDWKMQEILDQVGPGVTEIEMRRDNSFTVMGASQVKAEQENATTAGSVSGNAAGGSLPESSPKNMVAKAATKSAPVVEILSSDDEAPPPKAAPVHASTTATATATAPSAAAAAVAHASVPLLPTPPSIAGFVSGGIAHPQPVHAQPHTAGRGGGPPPVAAGRLAHLPHPLSQAPTSQHMPQPFAPAGSQTTANATAASTTGAAVPSSVPAAAPPRPVVASARSVVPTEVIEISSSDDEQVSSAPPMETSDASSDTDMSEFAGDSDSSEAEDTHRHTSTSTQRSHVENADREKTRKSRLRNLNKYYEHLNKYVDPHSNSAAGSNGTAISSSSTSSSSSSSSSVGGAGAGASGLMGPNGEYIPGITPPHKALQSSSSSSSTSTSAAAASLSMSPAILQASRLTNARLAATTPALVRSPPTSLSTSTPPRLNNHTRSESGSAKKTLRRGESTVRSGSSTQLPNSGPQTSTAKPLTASQSPADNKRRRQPSQQLTTESNQQADSTRPSSSSRSATRPRRVISDPSGSIRGSQNGSKRTSRSLSTSPRPQTRATTAAQNDKEKRKRRKEAAVSDNDAEDEAEQAEVESPEKSIHTPVRESPRETQFSSPYVGDPNVPRYLLFGDNEEEDDPNQLSISLSDDSLPRSPSLENITPPFTTTAPPTQAPTQTPTQAPTQTPTQLQPDNRDVTSTTVGVSPHPPSAPTPQVLSSASDSGLVSTQLSGTTATGSVPEPTNQLKRPIEMPEEPVNGKRSRIDEAEAENMEIDHSIVGSVTNRLSTAPEEDITIDAASDMMQVDPKLTPSHDKDTFEITGATTTPTAGSNPSPRGYGLPRKNSDSSSNRLGLESAGDSTDTDDEPEIKQAASGQQSQNSQVPE